MGEFTSLENDMIPIFQMIQHIKERYGITSLTLESCKYVEKFYGSHGGKGNFVGEREHRYAWDPKRNFIKMK